MNKIYIDTNCRVCNGYANFLKNKNSNIKLEKQTVLNHKELSKDELVYEKNQIKYYANEAIIESIYDLGGFYKFVKLLKIIPPTLSYSLYKIFSQNRYKLFPNWKKIKSYQINYLSRLYFIQSFEQFMDL